MNLLAKIKNAIRFRLKIREWKSRPTDPLLEYESLQVKGSMHTRLEPINQSEIKKALSFFYTNIPDKNSRILDAGCGDGWTLDELKKAGYGRLTGIDLSDEKVKIARDHGHDARKTMLPALPLEDASFDVVYCRHVYEHLLFPLETLRSFYRVLALGGLLFLIAPKAEISADSGSESHMANIRKPGDVESLIKKAGFKILKDQIHHLTDVEFWFLAKK